MGKLLRQLFKFFVRGSVGLTVIGFCAVLNFFTMLSNVCFERQVAFFIFTTIVSIMGFVIDIWRLQILRSISDEEPDEGKELKIRASTISGLINFLKTAKEKGKGARLVQKEPLLLAYYYEGEDEKQDAHKD